MEDASLPGYELPADPITTKPRLVAKYGRAWRFETLPTDTAIDCWLIEAPWAHPIWHSYGLSLIHLRHVTGMPDPTIYLDCATHELLLFALDPKQQRQHAIDTSMVSARAMRPANLAAQIIEHSDRTARIRIALAVRDIINGLLSPDTDFIATWIARFGDSMIRYKARKSPVSPPSFVKGNVP